MKLMLDTNIFDRLIDGVISLDSIRAKGGNNCYARSDARA